MVSWMHGGDIVVDATCHGAGLSIDAADYDVGVIGHYGGVSIITAEGIATGDNSVATGTMSGIGAPQNTLYICV